ncbi:Glucose-repressible alcohol dehydrogenase transcriptional effector [Cladochytrium tenue]|nr:Glucose-repressible alcohol dehydrogenase transcriptional effector [Cladochytrium tenue]
MGSSVSGSSRLSDLASSAGSRFAVSGSPLDPRAAAFTPGMLSEAWGPGTVDFHNTSTSNTSHLHIPYDLQAAKSAWELPPHDFKDVFLPELQKIGYDGHFQQKKKAHAADGSAIFYLEARFSLLAVQAFAYSDQVPQDPNTDLYQRLAPFPNIALICVFQNRQARSLRVRVVNTHFHWDPACADTKLLQAAILMEWLERTHRDVPTVVAADLNSRPGEAVVDFLVRGKVAPGPLFGDRDFGRFTASLTYSNRNPYTGASSSFSSVGSLSRDVDAASNLSGQGTPTGSQPQPLLLLRHGTKLASAYDRKDLPFTNKTDEFEGCIDHILYTSGTLSIRDVLGDFDNTMLNEREKENEASQVTDGVVFDEELDSTIGAAKEDAAANSDLSPPPSPQEETRSDARESDDEKGAEGSDSDAPDENASSVDPMAIPKPAISAATPAPASQKLQSYPAGPAPPLPQGYLARIKTLPTEHVPSDHLPLCAWLKWKTVPVGTGPISLTTGASERSRNRGGRRGGGSGVGVGASGSGVGTSSPLSAAAVSLPVPSVLSSSAPSKGTFAAAAAAAAASSSTVSATATVMASSPVVPAASLSPPSLLPASPAPQSLVRPPLPFSLGGAPLFSAVGPGAGGVRGAATSTSAQSYGRPR